MIEIQHSWVDEDGEKATHSFGMLNNATPSQIEDVVDALQTISAASLRRYGVVDTNYVQGYPDSTPGPYDIRDRLLVTFRCVSGALLKLSIPAPLQAVLANSDFVTLADPLIQELADRAIGYIQSQYGDPAASFVSAVRQHYSRKK